MENEQTNLQTGTQSYSDIPAAQASAQISQAPLSAESYFDGKTIQMLGWRLLGLLLTGITLGIGAPWAHCMILRWEARHTVINGKRLCFTGHGLQLLGKFFLWSLLTLITFGIYAIFIPVRMHKWRVSHTQFATGQTPPQQKTSTGLIIGIIAGIALFLAIAAAAILFFLPKLTAESRPTHTDAMWPQFYDDNTTAGNHTLPAEETVVDTTEVLYVVANGGLNLRTGPGQEYDIIRQLQDGSIVLVMGRQDGWVFTGEGWCSSDYLSAEAPTSNIPGIDALIGNWMVVSDFSRGDYGSWCRGGSITLNADGTFHHSMRDYYRESAGSGWYCPGGETSGGDCPHWKGTYTFTGSHLTLNYQYEEVSDYDYFEDGSPIYLGSHWAPVYRTVTLRVSMSNTGDLSLGYAAEIPIYTENAQGSTQTHQALYRLPDGNDTLTSIYHALNGILPY